MTERQSFVARAIGRVESALGDPAVAPKHGSEGAPQAWLVFDGAVADGLRDLRPGDDIVVLTWLDRAGRDVLVVHPRDDPAAPETGVFSTRSADRPNRSASTGPRSWPSRAHGSWSASSKRSTGRRSSTSKPALDGPLDG